MPTILELFKGSPQDLAVSATGNSSKSDFVKSVKSFSDQETKGLRVKSLVEANNPLIYGTGTIRITNRSIQTTEIQKASTGGDPATGGLVGRGLSQITGGKVNSLQEGRDILSEKLGLPQNLIPTTIVTNSDYFGDATGQEPNTMINLAKIRKDGAGESYGQFLKQIGGGSLNTIGRQIIGQGISLVKDKLRDTILGTPAGIGSNTPANGLYEYTSVTPYSIVIRDRKTDSDSENFRVPDFEATNLLQKTINQKSQNSTLGVVENLFPSVVIQTKYFGDGTGQEQDTMKNLAQLRKSDLKAVQGQFMKSTFGFNKKKVGRNNNGEGISLVKDDLNGGGNTTPANGSYEYSSINPYSKLIEIVKNTEPDVNKLQLLETQAADVVDELIKKTRDILNKNKKIGQVGRDSNDFITKYSDTNTYSEVVTNGQERNIYEEGRNGVSLSGDPDIRFANQPIDKIDLRLVSPVYGIERADGRFGLSEYAYKVDEGNLAPTDYHPQNPYLNEAGGKIAPLESKRGFSGKGDAINQIAPNDEYTKDQAERLGLIPFWVSGLDSSKPVFFRAILSSISETVTPSWNSSNFVGNPYKFYTYEGVERDLSFTLQLYCMNEMELVKNWEKIEYLTSKTYPIINNQSSFINAPFIKFRLGNMYVEKVAFIDQLSYTVDDNSTWETDIDGYLLPKFIEVQATFKFVEWEGIEKTLYNFRRSEDSIKAIKEERSEYIERREGLGTVVEKETTPTFTQEGVQVTEPSSTQKTSSSGKGGINSSPKDINTGKEVSTPKEENSENTTRRVSSTTVSGEELQKLRIQLSKYGPTPARVMSGQLLAWPDSKPYKIILGKGGFVYYKLVDNQNGEERWNGINQTGKTITLGFKPKGLYTQEEAKDILDGKVTNMIKQNKKR